MARVLRAIWRINAVVILVAGVMVCVVVAVALFLIVREAVRDRHMQDVANIAPEVAKGEVFEFDRMVRIRGTPMLMLELGSRQRYRMGSFAKEANSIRNILFYDSETAKGRWLFPQHDMLLADIEPLAERGEREGRVRWVLFQVVKKDTNHDQQTGSGDLKTVSIADFDGQNYKEVLDGVERVLGVEFIGPDVVDLAFSGVNADEMAEIDLSRREVRRRTTLRLHHSK